ncbi:hypothetical protein Tco_0256134 [Tanacetum coccineum]
MFLCKSLGNAGGTNECARLFAQDLYDGNLTLFWEQRVLLGLRRWIEKNQRKYQLLQNLQLSIDAKTWPVNWLEGSSSREATMEFGECESNKKESGRPPRNTKQQETTRAMFVVNVVGRALAMMAKDCRVRFPDAGGNALQNMTCFGCGEGTLQTVQKKSFVSSAFTLFIDIATSAFKHYSRREAEKGSSHLHVIRLDEKKLDDIQVVRDCLRILDDCQDIPPELQEKVLIRPVISHGEQPVIFVKKSCRCVLFFEDRSSLGISSVESSRGRYTEDRLELDTGTLSSQYAVEAG